MAGSVRHPIDLASLESYIDAQVPIIKTPLQLKQFGHGQSNPTYQLTDSKGVKYVLRKKPPGVLLTNTAHRVDREYTILHALAGTDVPVPRVYHLCQDTTIIGTDFYIMEFLDGRIVGQAHFPGFSPEERSKMWFEAMRTLALLHQVDLKQVGLTGLAKHGNFYNRQIKSFTALSRKQAKVLDVESRRPVGSIPDFDKVASFFGQTSRQPRDRVSLVHGDFKIDNLVYHKTEPRIIGVLDWEVATIGHPLSDIVSIISPWVWADTASGSKQLVKDSEYFTPGLTPGLPPLQRVLDWYTESSGYDPHEDIAWGNAFGGFRRAVIVQGIAARYAQRQANSTSAKDYGSLVTPLGKWTSRAVDELEKSSRDSKL